MKKITSKLLVASLLFLVLSSVVRGQSSISTKRITIELQVLFEAKFEAEGEVKPFVETQDIFGQDFSMARDLISQGEGTINGLKLRGTISWSKLATRHSKQNYNNTLVAGWIYTNDGAEIMFEARGYAVRIGDTNSNKWSYTGALRFEDPDSPYEWLSDVVGIWVGEFDSATGSAHYTAYIPKDSRKLK